MHSGHASAVEVLVQIGDHAREQSLLALSYDMSLRNTFSRASVTGETALTMSENDRRELARSALQQLEGFDPDSDKAGEHAMQRILQPLFALSGYRLRAEAVQRDQLRFDLVGENIIGGDDRILVDFKFTKSKTGRFVPQTILDFVEQLPPDDQTRVIVIGNTALPEPSNHVYRREFGPQLELWSFDDIRESFQTILLDQGDHDNKLVAILIDFLDKLALGIADAEIELRQVEWRDLERMIGHVLRELGYAVTVTNSSHDGGRDIIVADVNAQPMGIYNIEVKHWTEKCVGEREVRRLLEVSLQEKRDGALMLATSGVGPTGLRVRTESMIDYLRFGRDSKIMLTCRSFARRRAGLWAAPRPFKTFLVEQTL